MKRIIGISGDRSWPPHLLQNLTQQEYTLLSWPPKQSEREELMASADAFMIFSPLLIKGNYIAAEELWKRYLELHSPHLKLICASFRAAQGSNDVDLLNLPGDWADFLEQAQPIGQLGAFTPCGGLDLCEKLSRFFAGHGQESVIALLNRLRMLVQMAHREVVQLNANYDEVYSELLAPAALAHKWAEWQNRWDNYAAFFQAAPFADVFNHLEEVMPPLAQWMQQGGIDPAPLREGKVLAVLDEIKREFTKIEHIYVGQELPYSYR